MALNVLEWDRRCNSQLGTVVFTACPVESPLIGALRGVAARRAAEKEVSLSAFQDWAVPRNQGETSCARAGASGASIKSRQQARRNGNSFIIRALGAKRFSLL